MKQWKLLEPFTLANVTLKNRIVMPPMCTRLAAPDGSVTTKMVKYYSERAKGGAGAVIVEYSYIDELESRAAVCQLGVYSDHLIPGLNNLAESIQFYDTVAILQICHAGRQTTSSIIRRTPVAPSPIRSRVTSVAGLTSYSETPRELQTSEIERIQDSFAQAARRARQAGFNGVEVHGAHGYLLSQFLSPYTNRRGDKYGVDLKGRALFALETIERVRGAVGPDFVVGYRVSADEFVEQGIALGEVVEFAQLVEQAGVDYVHVTGGIGESAHHQAQPIYVERGHLLHLAERIRSSVEIPVIAVGSLDAETAEQALQRGAADLCAMGRALIADPELPNKIVQGKPADIRPCIRGNEGCVSGFFSGHSVKCEVNPSAGREERFSVQSGCERKKVLVVGGGIAGMEAARVASMHGHDVCLCEKSAVLGGHILEASMPAFKADTRALLAWLIAQLEQSSVEIRMTTDVTPDLVRKLEPDALIVAIGSDYTTPAVRGINGSCVVGAYDVLMNNASLGAKAAVVGGGTIGCETALFVAEELGKDALVVEMRDDILIGSEPTSAGALMERMERAGVAIRTGLRVDEIARNTLVCTDATEQRHEIEADSVIVAVGLQARKESIDVFAKLCPAVYAIGDYVEPKNIYHAFEDAWKAVLRI